MSFESFAQTFARAFAQTFLALVLSTLMMIPIFNSSPPSVPCEMVNAAHVPTPGYRCRLSPEQGTYVEEPIRVFFLELLRYASINLSFFCVIFYRLFR